MKRGAVAFLAQQARGGPAPELAIGTGRIALPLAAHGIRVDGAQVIEENHVTLGVAGLRFNPVVQRYAWPSELDLMAAMAGLRLRERWGSWNREPFTGESSLHVSVYGR